jgi:hypothetical protein
MTAWIAPSARTRAGLPGQAMNGKAMNFKAFSVLPAVKLILAPG